MIETPLVNVRAPVAVVIPTYGRGLDVLKTLRPIHACSPQPAEIWVHVDCSDGTIERTVVEAFPEVKLLSSPNRLRPGGGRHRLLMACQCRFAASFDDDSYPVDLNLF
jgi:glycosyltransferase involved in cell wall biosynthesis